MAWDQFKPSDEDESWPAGLFEKGRNRMQRETPELNANPVDLVDMIRVCGSQRLLGAWCAAGLRLQAM